MPAAANDRENLFQRPGKYRIRVQGFLDESWSARLCGMHITPEGPDDARTATLEGHLRDQAQLCGVLNSLYELHLSILSVTLIASETRENTPS